MSNYFKDKRFINKKGEIIKNTLIIITLFLTFIIISAYSYASSISTGLAENIILGTGTLFKSVPVPILSFFKTVPDFFKNKINLSLPLVNLNFL